MYVRVTETIDSCCHVCLQRYPEEVPKAGEAGK